MGADSKISWTTHTFNCWWGCTKVGGSPACDHCYAETFARRLGYSDLPKASKFPIWGDDAARRYFNENHWLDPIKWDRDAARAGLMDRVFCMSMGDWAEGRPEQQPYLERLWKLQHLTPNLNWLMLTKRPQLIRKLSTPHPRRWFGTTVENQRWMDIRWPHLRDTESPVYWLSMEPLMERVTLPDDFLALGQRAWVIVGGESGHHARPMHPEWARRLRDQCVEAGVPFHFKQQGEWVQFYDRDKDDPDWRDCPQCKHPNERYVNLEGGHGFHGERVIAMRKIGTARAGHLLDGVEWLQRPDPARVREETSGNT